MNGEKADTWEQLLSRSSERVRAVTNLLVESPYFYHDDDEGSFNFLRRHRSEFAKFFDVFFGWVLVVDTKCARLYKERWYNNAVTESMRDQFNFTRRDECIAFMMILEFFEHQLADNDMTVEDRDNLRFRFGDLLEFCTRRFGELVDDTAQRYTAEQVRARILRQVFPVLERYRFLKRVPPPPGETIDEEQTIYEALPAIYHYNSSYLHRHVDEMTAVMGGSEAETVSDQDMSVEEPDMNATGEDVPADGADLESLEQGERP